jgi:capsular polysaccharide biosynthesis protein
MLSGVISYYVLTPTYQSSTQILVNQKDINNELDATQMRSNIELINTYSVIIKSPAILEIVIKKLNLKQGVDQLNQNISVTSQSDSQVFSITVKDSNPAMAVKIANTISETFQQEIKGIMNVDNVNILAKAELGRNPLPVSPNPVLNIAVGFIVGVLLGIGLAFLLEYLDNSLKTSEEVEAFLELPVLGSVYKMPKQSLKKSSQARKIRGETFGTQIEG